MRSRFVLWLRAFAFSVLGPGMLGGFVPFLIGPRRFASGLWSLGWLLVVAGCGLYLLSLLCFLSAQGTPAIFFTRGLRQLWGEEPRLLVRRSLYGYSRNPMYLGVVSAILGQAVLFRSLAVAVYGFGLFCFFHLIVTLVEEPHLRARDGKSFDEYCRSTPRWLGRRRIPGPLS